MIEENKPRLVETGSGFSVFTVEYRGRFLYSKYNPSRSIEAVIEKTEIQPSTLIILNSPCLFYGLEKLLEKLPADCCILAIEDDDNLLDLAKKSLETLANQNGDIDFSAIRILSTKRLLEIDSSIRKTVDTGKIRRVISFDLSAGKIFNPEIYNLILSAAQEIIGTFWKNRITLVKMGRLFSKNLFTNLKSLDSENLLSQFRQTINKPILVCGAGESLDITTKKDSTPFSKALYAGNFYVIAVDASLTTLLDRGIRVDAAVGLESQFAIQKAYIGMGNSRPLFFADLCSRPQVQRLHDGRTVWFMSEYTSANFISKLKELNIIQDFIPPLGSVGLAAVYIALILRNNKSLPIFLTGLDFSYSPGKTHASFTPAHKDRLFSLGRTKSLDNMDAAFSPAASFVMDKKGGTTVSSTIMLSYRQYFENSFSKFENLFDIGETGLPLGLNHLTSEQAFNQCRLSVPGSIPKNAPQKKEAGTFLANEKKCLMELRDLLSNGENSEFYTPGTDLTARIQNLLQDREYLYLHFPDGYALSMNPIFLKRVRAEIDFFLKIIG